MNVHARTEQNRTEQNRTEPLLAVIVPVYKVEKYLPKCLDSIINQTYKNLHIICVNDGSPDNCGVILDEYAKKDTRITVIHRENGGAAIARNAALDYLDQQNYQYEVYITFVDADDYLEKDAFDIAMSRFTSDQIDIVCFGFERVFENNKNSKKICIEPSHALGKIGLHKVDDDVVDNISYYTHSKIYRADVILHNKIRFPAGLKFEDSYFGIASLLFCRYVYFEPFYPYKYIQREDSLSGIAQKDQNGGAFHFVYICLAALDFFKKHDLLESHNNYFWIFYYKMIYWAIEIADNPDMEKAIYNKALEIKIEVNQKLATPVQKHYNELIKKQIFKERTFYSFLGLLKTKHRAAYDKYYILGIPVLKISYTHNNTIVAPFCLFNFNVNFP